MYKLRDWSWWRFRLTRYNTRHPELHLEWAILGIHPYLYRTLCVFWECEHLRLVHEVRDYGLTEADYCTSCRKMFNCRVTGKWVYLTQKVTLQPNS